jgi:transcriptional regulator GlxA family with amidase domain
MLDLSGPLAAFEIASSLSEDASYSITTVSLEGGAVDSSSGLAVVTKAVGEITVDTFIVVGASGPLEPELLARLSATARASASTSRRIASICTGAFVLAEAGLLDGRVATTHWKYTARLQKLYLDVKVDGDRIYTHDGSVWTSAGITAGIDLALALIEDDLGADLSSEVARMLVVYQRRSGGQSQFSNLLELDADSDRIKAALRYARENMAEKLSVEALAKVAGLGARQFGRAFQTETGETPAKAIERMRAEVARIRIETTNDPIEEIAQDVGFTDPERMRRAFVRLFGHPPQGLRRVARAG